MFPGWVLLAVSGSDAERFLHAQLTSDVRALDNGRSQVTALLDASGRLRSYGYLLRRGQSFLFLLPDCVAGATQAALEASIIADDVTVEGVAAPEMRLALGPRALVALPEQPAETVFPLEIYAHRGFVTWGEAQLDLPPLPPELLEALRVLSGLPAWGVDISDGQLVSETSLLRSAVSFSKGCYLGQETVAKVSSHRGAAHAATLLRVQGEPSRPRPLVGCQLEAEGRKVGPVLAAARWDGELFLEVSLHRDLRVRGRRLEVAVEGEPAFAARVEDLPYLKVRRPEEHAAELWREGVACFAADDEDGAIALLEGAIAVCPSFADAYESLGVIHGRRGDLERAIDLMHGLLEVDPGSVMAHSNLSQYYGRLDRIEEAEDEKRLAAVAGMRQQRRDRESDQEAQAGREAEQADDHRREEMLRRVLEVDPDDAFANFGLGELLLARERPDEAIAHLERALDSDPQHPAAYLALGRALAAQGRRDRATAVWAHGVGVAASRGDVAVANILQSLLAG
jgi:folate-binding protein YgfZ